MNLYVHASGSKNLSQKFEIIGRASFEISLNMVCYSALGICTIMGGLIFELRSLLFSRTT